MQEQFCRYGKELKGFFCGPILSLQLQRWANCQSNRRVTFSLIALCLSAPRTHGWGVMWKPRQLELKSSDVCVALHLKPNDECGYDHKLFLSRSESVGVKTLKSSSSKIVAHYSSCPLMMSYLGCFETGSAVWAGLMVLLISVAVCLHCMSHCSSGHLCGKGLVF